MTEVPEERRKGARREEDVADKQKKYTAEEIRRSLRLLALATAVVYIALGGLAVKSYVDGKRTNDALCTYREDLVRRVLTATEYLRDHPEGNPALGLDTKDILTNIANQQRAINAFGDLKCPDPPAPVEVTPTPSSFPGPPTPTPSPNKEKP